MQGRLQYPGIPDWLSFRYVLSHGISPGRISVRSLPERSNPAVTGTARLVFGGVTIEIPDCRLDRIDFEVDDSGRQVARYEILDGRWKWRGGHISGRYNVRTKGGDSVESGTEKTPRELATLCLNEMGVRSFEVKRMPNQARPYVDWDYDIPAKALADLCDSLNCTVVYQPGGRVSIEQVGQGRGLSITNLSTSGEVNLVPPRLNEGLKFVAAPTLYQMDFELDAVGEELDGTVRRLNNLSYTPPGGWADEMIPGFPNVAAASRELAQQSVYRMYRIVFPTPLFPPGKPQVAANEIDRLEQILPLIPHQVEQDEFPDGSKQRRPPWVYGTFNKGTATYPTNPPNLPPNPDLNRAPADFYSRSFTLDRERGIVIFSEPVYDLDTSVQGFRTRQPRLNLRVAVTLRDSKTRGVERWTKLRGKDGKSQRALIVERSDIGLEYYENHRTGRVIDNLAEVEKQAGYYLDAARDNLQKFPGGSVQYAGFVPIAPDGAIRQVSWSVDGSGVATTLASLNREQPGEDMSFEEKRLFERMMENLAKQRQQQQAAGGGANVP